MEIILFSRIISVGYRHVGCFEEDDKSSPKPVQLCGEDKSLSNDSKIQRCADAARIEGYKAFGVQRKGQCWAWLNAISFHDVLVPMTNCKDGIGKTNAYDIYSFNSKCVDKIILSNRRFCQYGTETLLLAGNVPSYLGHRSNAHMEMMLEIHLVLLSTSFSLWNQNKDIT
jgi:hypothetical protein